MRKFILVVTAAAMVIGVSSCNKELSSSKIDFEAAPQEIAMRAFTGAQSVFTKSAFKGDAFPDGYDMLVSAYRNLDDAHKGSEGNIDAAANYFEGIKFSKNSTIWKPATPKYWPLTGTLDFLAIASAGLNTAANGIVPTCVWGDENSNVAKEVVVTVPDNSGKFDDVLFGSSNGQNWVSAGNPMEFKHAMTAVVFTLKSSLEYNATNNVGITVDSITIDGAKWSGKFTVTNPGAAGGTGSIAATWDDVSLGDSLAHIAARVWDSANDGIKPAESALSNFIVLTTACELEAKPFGEAYAILPEQDAVEFTITYTIHNGKDANGAALDNQIKYQFHPAENSRWAQGTKNVYAIAMTLNDITISPSVVDWGSASENVPINQSNQPKSTD